MACGFSVLPFPKAYNPLKWENSAWKKVPQSARLSAGGGCNCYLGNAQIEVGTYWKGLPLTSIITVFFLTAKSVVITAHFVDTDCDQI